MVTSSCDSSFYKIFNKYCFREGFFCWKRQKMPHSVYEISIYQDQMIDWSQHVRNLHVKTCRRDA